MYTKTITAMGYTITSEPVIVVERSDELNKKSYDIFKLLPTDPQSTISKLIVLINEYPNDPIIAGYLAIAYQQTNQQTNQQTLAKKTIINNYKKFPLYLFARIAYADLCLEEDRIIDATKAINAKFDLKMLYPERDLFHFTEAINFWTLCAKYYGAIGDFEQANVYVEMLQKLSPDHPSIAYVKKYLRYCRSRSSTNN